MRLINVTTGRKIISLEMTDHELIMLLIGYGQSNPRERKEEYNRRFGVFTSELEELNTNHSIYTTLKEIVVGECHIRDW